MSKAKLEALGQGRFRVSGVLDASTVGEVLHQSEARFPEAATVDVDMSGVSEADSAGLALLIEWLRMARQRQQPIHYANVPAQIAALARISEVEDLIGNGKNGAPVVAAS